MLEVSEVLLLCSLAASKSTLCTKRDAPTTTAPCAPFELALRKNEALHAAKESHIHAKLNKHDLLETLARAASGAIDLLHFWGPRCRSYARVFRCVLRRRL